MLSTATSKACLVRAWLYRQKPQSLTARIETESGVNEGVTAKFPGSVVKTGSQASGQGDNREIPVDEGGDLIRKPGEKGGAGQYVIQNGQTVED